MPSRENIKLVKLCNPYIDGTHKTALSDTQNRKEQGFWRDNLVQFIEPKRDKDLPHGAF